MDTISWGQWTKAWPEVVTGENTFPAPGTLDQILPMGQTAKEARGKDFIQNPCFHNHGKEEFRAAFLAFSSQIHPRYTLKVKSILLLGHLPSEIYLIIRKWNSYGRTDLTYIKRFQPDLWMPFQGCHPFEINPLIPAEKVKLVPFLIKRPLHVVERL